MVLALSLIGLMLQEPVDVLQEAALQKKVSVLIKEAELPQALKILSQSLGAPVEAVTPLWKSKVTIFCKEEPAANIMASLAGVLDCEWTKDGGTYRLRRDREQNDDREAYVKAEDRQLRDLVEKSLVQVASGAKTRPAEGGQGIRPPESGAQVLPGMLRSLSSSDLSSLWRGEAITWAPTIPGGPNRESRVDEIRRVVMQYNPTLGTLKVQPGDSALYPGVPKLVPFSVPPAPISTMKFIKDVGAWAASGKLPEDKRFSVPVKGIRTAQVAEYYAPTSTFDDQAESYFQSTGLPIVADAFSVPTEMSDANTVAAWMSTLVALGLQSRVENGVMEVRHYGFWRLARFEISDSVLSGVVNRAGGEPLDLSGYAKFLAGLSADQIGGLSLEHGIVTPFDPAPFHEMMRALLYYSMLNPSQRQFAKDGLAVAKLPASLQRAFQQVVLVGSLTEGHARLVAQVVSGNLDQLGVTVSEKGQAGNGRPKVASRTLLMSFGNSEEQMGFASSAKAPVPIAR